MTTPAPLHRRILCSMFCHPLTEVIQRPWYPLKEFCPGRTCKCGKRHTVILCDGTEKEVTV